MPADEKVREILRATTAAAFAREYLGIGDPVDCGWTSVTYLTDGRMIATQDCGAEAPERRVTGGRIVSFGARRPQVFLTTGDPITSVSADASGDHLLLGMRRCGGTETCEDAPEAVARCSVDGDPVPVGTDLTQAVWLT